MKCSKCGKENQEGSLFCTHCGSVLDDREHELPEIPVHDENLQNSSDQSTDDIPILTIPDEDVDQELITPEGVEEPQPVHQDSQEPIQEGEIVYNHVPLRRSSSSSRIPPRSGNQIREEDIEMPTLERDLYVEKTPAPNRSRIWMTSILLVLLTAGICGGIFWIGYQSAEQKYASSVTTTNPEIPSQSTGDTQTDADADQQTTQSTGDSATTSQNKSDFSSAVEDNKTTTPLPSTNSSDSKDKEETTKTSYTLNYNMNVRETPSADAKQTGYLKKGSTVSITETVTASDGSTWGKIADKQYICLKDGNYTYATKSTN